MSSLLQAMPSERPIVFTGLCDAPVKAGKELGLALAIQNILVPAVAYEDKHVEVYGQTIPREDLGGDLVDLVAAGRDIVAYVADVSGHGFSAAVLMGMVKTEGRRPSGNTREDFGRDHRSALGRSMGPPGPSSREPRFAVDPAIRLFVVRDHRSEQTPTIGSWPSLRILPGLRATRK